jgi:hypothetical protein
MMETRDSVGGLARLSRSYITLGSPKGDSIVDSTWVQNGSEWRLDTIRQLRFEFYPVGDGYDRAVEVHKVGGETVDTTLHYWYFFTRGDTLFHYVGMRFLGNNSGLKGTWVTEAKDAAYLNGYCSLSFDGDSVTIQQGSGSSGGVTGVYSYSTNRDTIHIDTDTFAYGDRYELLPGIHLYITSRATSPYVAVK